MEKVEIRKKVNAAILSMTLDDRTRRSLKIQEKVLALPEFASARCVAAYAAMPFEVSTDIIMEEALLGGKTLALPRINWKEHRLDWVAVADIERDLKSSNKGILEPVGDALIPPQQIDLVIVPGRAFDRSCNRLGQGGGFYDAFLGSLRSDCLTCAVAFDVQILDWIPLEPHDIPVNIVVTESEQL